MCVFTIISIVPVKSPLGNSGVLFFLHGSHAVFSQSPRTSNNLLILT